MVSCYLYPPVPQRNGHQVSKHVPNTIAYLHKWELSTFISLIPSCLCLIFLQQGLLQDLVNFFMAHCGIKFG